MLIAEGLALPPALVVPLLAGVIFLGYLLERVWKFYSWFKEQISAESKGFKASLEKHLAELETSSERTIQELRAHSAEQIRQLEREHETQVALLRGSLDMESLKARAAFDAQIAAMKAQGDAIERFAKLEAAHQEELLSSKLEVQKMRQSGFEKLLNERLDSLDVQRIGPASTRPGPPVGVGEDTSPGIPKRR